MTSTISLGLSGVSSELASLRGERDPELRAEGILNFAGRLERRGKDAEAAAIYQELIAENSQGAHRARERLAVLQGGGPIGAQVERLLGRFVGEASDPSLILAMGAASSIASLTRFGLMARFSAASGSWATRGLLGRFFAGAGALAVEAPAFTLSHRLATSMLGRPMDSSAQAWGRELASGYLMLGAFRASSALVGALRIPGANPWSALPRFAANMGALLAVHSLEARWGWRPRQDWGAAVTESLATLLQLSIAGRLSHQLWGSRFERLSHVFVGAPGGAQSAETAISLPWATARGAPTGFAFAGLGSPRGAENRISRGPRFANQVWMSSMQEGGSSRPSGKNGNGPGNGNGTGNGNGNATLRRASELWAEWVQRQPEQAAQMDRREASYAGEASIPRALDESLVQLRGRTVLVVQLDIPVREAWPRMAKDFLGRNPQMEEIVLADPYGEGWWAGRPPLEENGRISLHSLSGPEFRGRRRAPGMILGLTLRDAWQRWPSPPPFAECLKQARLKAGLTIAQAVARLQADSSLTSELQSYRMKGVEARHLQYAENGYRLPVAYPLLQRLARIYRVDPRRFVQASNRSVYPEVPVELWSTPHYPLYLEGQAELGRMEHFARLKAEGRNLEREFPWLLFSARKNPERYRRIPDLAAQHELTQGELAAWELGEGTWAPSLEKLNALAGALELPLDRLIHSVNRSFYGELDLESLFPGQAVYINSAERDVETIQAYQETPGSPGQFVFAARKALPLRPTRAQWVEAEGYGKSYLYERERNLVRIGASNLGEWTELFRRLQAPPELIKLLAKAHGKVLISSPAHLLAEQTRGRSLQALSEQTGLSIPTLSDTARLNRSVKPATIRDLKAAMPDLDAAGIYLRAHPEIRLFFPETGTEGDPTLELQEAQVRAAQRFHLGTELFAFRHDPPPRSLKLSAQGQVDMETLASLLGVSKQTVSLYESVFVRIEEPKVLMQISELLGLDRRMLYLHYNPEILDIFPSEGIDPEGASASFLKEANRFYDRNNLRRHLFSEVLRRRNGSREPVEGGPEQVLTATLGIDRSLAEKFLGEARILRVEDIRRLGSLVPSLDYRRWYEHFYRSRLAFFLGTDAEGRIRFDAPPALPEAQTPAEIVAGFRDHLRSRGLRLPTRWGALQRTLLAGGEIETTSLARLARDFGIDRRWLYFHFRRTELEPILRAPQP